MSVKGVAENPTDREEINRIKEQTAQVLRELLDAAVMKEGQILVAGCSSQRDRGPSDWLLFQRGGWKSCV